MANSKKQSEIELRGWSEDDLPLLERLMGDPAMTVYLGGPEPAENIRKRHELYLNMAESKGRMFVILAGPERVTAGSVGYWESESDGQAMWEIGWSVLPEFQGQGIATMATAAAVERARADNKFRYMVAFPAVENGASNTIARNVGFILQGEIELPFWREPDKFAKYHIWRLDLAAQPGGS